MWTDFLSSCPQSRSLRRTWLNTSVYRSRILLLSAPAPVLSPRSTPPNHKQNKKDATPRIYLDAPPLVCALFNHVEFTLHYHIYFYMSTINLL